MKSFNKIISPTISDGKIKNYIQIELRDGELSMVGVMGPKRNGNCAGSAGQCIGTICDLNNDSYDTKPREGYTPEILEKINNIWREYHLNYASPYDEEMKKLGWDKLASKRVYKLRLDLKPEIAKRKREIENRVMKEIKERREAAVTEEEQEILNLENFKTIYSYDAENPTLPKHYYIRKNSSSIVIPRIEPTILGHVKCEEFEDGLLGKVCPASGNRYGCSWYHIEIPEELVEFLYSLPESPEKPIWI